MELIMAEGEYKWVGGRGEDTKQKPEVQWVQVRQNSRLIRPGVWIRIMDLGRGKGVTVRQASKPGQVRKEADR